MKNLPLYIIACLLLLGFYLFFRDNFSIKNFKPDSTTPTTQPTENDVRPLVIVDYPKPNDVVTSPLVVRGKATGGWYFEGEFPMTLYWGMGEEFVTGIAMAKGEWMTEDYVDFEVTLEFPEPYAEEGALVLEKSNPSGLQELSDSLRIPVRFK